MAIIAPQPRNRADVFPALSTPLIRAHAALFRALHLTRFPFPDPVSLNPPFREDSRSRPRARQVGSSPGGTGPEILETAPSPH